MARTTVGCDVSSDRGSQSEMAVPGPVRRHPGAGRGEQRHQAVGGGNGMILSTPAHVNAAALDGSPVSFAQRRRERAFGEQQTDEPAQFCDLAVARQIARKLVRQQSALKQWRSLLKMARSVGRIAFEVWELPRAHV